MTRRKFGIGLIIIALITLLWSSLNDQSQRAELIPNAQTTIPVENRDKFDGENSKQAKQLMYVEMINDRLGFALQSKGVLRTIDGGNTWSQTLSFGDLPNDNHFEFTDLTNPSGVKFNFINLKVGWIAIGDSEKANTLILHTIDGGEKWEIHNIKATGIISLNFVDEQRGWLMTNTQGGAMGSQTAEIYFTKDGGENWSEIMKTGPENLAPGVLPFAGHKTGITFKDALHGWSAGGIGWSDSVWWYFTKDGGHTWQVQNVPKLPAMKGQNVYPVTSPPKFFSKNDGIFEIVFRGDTDGEMKVAFYLTENGGVRWEPSEPLVVSGTFAFDFLNLKAGMLVNGHDVYLTRDGGKHWNKSTSNLKVKVVNSLKCINQDVAFLTSFDVENEKWELYKTNDGGRTWFKLNVNE